MLKRSYLYIEKKKSFFEDITRCKEKLQEEYPLKTIIGITVFIDASGVIDFLEKKEIVRGFFSEHFGNLPLSIVSQPAITERPVCMALEIWTHDSCQNPVYKKEWGLNYVVYEDVWGKSLWGFGMSTNDATFSFREQAHYSFDAMQAILVKEGFTMDHIVRQWNYLPDILRTTTENGRLSQNYQLFNDIRQYYYGIYKRNTVYPSATGIGMDCGPVSIDFFALQPHDSIRLVGLNNPNQSDAYHYGQQVLVGSPLQENEGKKAPLFERAKYIGSNHEALVFISGTASIIGEETVGSDDVAKQTVVTIENISALTSEKGAYFRVYVKHPEDIPTVRKICEERYEDTAILYVKADVCRDNLLIEIEGEAEIYL
jgi:enamine deaminase RidA (YjgF/YER057c/UK114 family)